MSNNVTPFYEGTTVAYIGPDAPATGTLMAFASSTAAHVKWSSGPRTGQIDMVDLYDLTPTASQAALESPRITAFSVRRVMNSEGTPGVLNYLASAQQLATWPGIAQEALEFVEARLRSDPSMELAYEQLRPEEVDSLAALGAQVLLRDAFAVAEE